MNRVVVTGGAGFIGSHLVDYLISHGKLVLIIDNLSSGRMSNLSNSINNQNFLFLNCDITSEKLYETFEYFKPQIVYHLAAIPGVQFSVEKPFESNNSNVTGLLNVLEASRTFGVERVVFSSSSAVYGNTEVLPTNEKLGLNPLSPYALQKYVGEAYCKMYSDLYDLDTVSLRYFNVMGPRQYGDSPYSSVVSLFSNSIKNKSIPNVYGDGEQSRDFCPVENVVLANFLAGKRKEKFDGISINIGMGESVSINKLLSLMKIGDANYLEARMGEVKHSIADISRARDLLGYNPVVDFRSGLKKTIEWYLSL